MGKAIGSTTLAILLALAIAITPAWSGPGVAELTAATGLRAPIWAKARNGAAHATFRDRALGSAGSRGRSGTTTDFLSGLTYSGVTLADTPRPSYDYPRRFYDCCCCDGYT